MADVVALQDVGVEAETDMLLTPEIQDRVRPRCQTVGNARNVFEVLAEVRMQRAYDVPDIKQVRRFTLFFFRRLMEFYFVCLHVLTVSFFSEPFFSAFFDS